METNGYRLLLPEGTLDYFNISDVKESSTEITIYLEEKNEVPKEYSESKVEQLEEIKSVDNVMIR